MQYHIVCILAMGDKLYKIMTVSALLAGSIPQRVQASNPVVYGIITPGINPAGESNPWVQVANVNPLKVD